MVELAPMRGGAIWLAREARLEPVEESLATAVADEHSRVVAGTFDGVVVGYAVARTEDMPRGGRLGVVKEIFVESEARGVGVGEAMMDDLVAWCRDRECVGIDSMALPGARETKNFFEDSGFTARQLVMHKPLKAG
jgi:GNAT superfamily N-acetyltransferase